MAVKFVLFGPFPKEVTFLLKQLYFLTINGEPQSNGNVINFECYRIGFEHNLNHLIRYSFHFAYKIDRKQWFHSWDYKFKFEIAHYLNDESTSYRLFHSPANNSFVICYFSSFEFR